MLWKKMIKGLLIRTSVDSLEKTCTRYKIEISADKSKLMTNSGNGIQREIKVNDRSWTSFRYLGASVPD